MTCLIPPNIPKPPKWKEFLHKVLVIRVKRYVPQGMLEKSSNMIPKVMVWNMYLRSNMAILGSYDEISGVQYLQLF